MENLYGQIELTQLGEIIKANPSSVKVVTDKNGVQRKYLNIYINERQQVGKYGHTHYIKVGVKKEEQKDGVNYFIGELQPQKNGNAAPAPTAEQQATLNEAAKVLDSLPF
jgi:hypothetical protein